MDDTVEPGVVQEVWIRATQQFNTLTHDPKKQKFVREHSLRDPYQFHNSLLEHAKELPELKYDDQSAWRRRFQRLLQTINEHACIGDVVVQSQGAAVTFSWASIRLCLLLATANFSIGRDIADNILDLTEYLTNAEARLQLLPFAEPLLRSTVRLFASALLYVVNAIFFLQKQNRPIRALKAASGSSAKFKRMFMDIQENLNMVDREFSNAQEVFTRRRDRLELLLKHLPQKQLGLESCSPAPGTGQWLQKSDEFRAWVHSAGSNILFVTGAHGSGKTVLAEHLHKTSSDRLKFLHSCHLTPGIYSFCSATISWLVTLVKHCEQPASWHDLIVTEALTLSDLACTGRRIEQKPLEAALHKIFASSKLPKTTLVIDAFSGYDRDAQSLFKLLESLCQSPQVKLLVFSRSSPQTISVSVCLITIQMDAPRTKPDVELYAEKRIEKSDTLPAVKAEILRSIEKECLGLFLWTKMLLDDLECAHSKEDQLDILNNFPERLFDRLQQLWARHQGSLDEKDRARSLEIYILVVASRKLLTADEVSAFLALDSITSVICEARRLSNPARSIEKLCQPLVVVEKGHVSISHPVMRDFLIDYPLAHTNPDDHMAQKCLSVLTEAKYTFVPYAAVLLRQHLLPTGFLVSEKISISVTEVVPYEYAALHWQIHVTAVSKPSKALLDKLADFITSIAAVTWSERLIDIRARNEESSINPQIDIRRDLAAWLKRLPPEQQKRIPLDEFFVTPHIKIREKLAENDEKDRLLPYLPAMRLGQYFSIAGSSDDDFRQAYEYKKLVVDGFTELLGKENPLTLRARTDFINQYFSQGLIAEAEVELINVVDIERRVLGTDSEVYYETVQLLGIAQYSLTKLDDAHRSFDDSEEGSLRLRGKESWHYQVNNLYYGWVYEREGDLSTAMQLYERIVETWIPSRGKTNGLSIFAATSIGSVLRKRQAYDTARTNLKFSWDTRQQLFTINSNTTVDSGLQLALLYRDMGLAAAGLQLLDEVETSSVFKNDFERTCQAKHIRALIAFDSGHFSEPVNDLTNIINETVGPRRQYNNRECQWVRLTLGDALTHAGRDADALMLFSELVEPLEDNDNSRPATPTLNDEPESPAQLDDARTALRMVKDRDPSGAHRFLKSKKLQWKRAADFFIRQGGPPADTAWIAPVKFSNVSAA